ncbi:STAS-like domain-containing protein [Methylovulum psychrotolerans]|uniref:DUF4325 domain-containing protein n=1 Tax=Methylovulum psychrotolerans TaxID=1704499 RepID=A0A1Z4C367_9GAMM|nr:STAS-like domain-containing protein [Methylovulum psychrotolerans]ASF47961.1 hypothetical protein CEK71_18855 [Methylovulum psychrotolerans]
MKSKTIIIANDYTDTPAGRYKTDGSYSGERFREEFLYPALQDNDEVNVDLNGALGFGSSFLEEAFGGLIREKGMPLADIKGKLKIVSSRALYNKRIWSYLEKAQAEKSKVW